MKKLKKFLPLGFIVLAWLIFSFPYFFQHKVPYASRYQVTFFTPWNQYQQYAGPVKNNAMPDVIDEIYPWKHFTIEQLKKGQLALWNPYSFAGTPHLADSQSTVLSPFNVLFLFLPFVDAWSLFILLQPLLAGIFIYLFLKAIKVSVIGRLIASVAWMFCGFIVVWMAYGTLAMAIVFLPLSLWAIEKIFHKKKLLGSIVLPLSIATSFFSGHIQTSFYFMLYVFVYLLFKCLTTKDYRAFLWAICFSVLGLLISLLQILPSWELYKLSVRSEIFSNAGGILPHYLVTVFAPDFYGNPITRNDWVGHYAEWASFIGMIPFTLAVFALYSFFSSKKSERNPFIIFFFFAGLLALLFSLQTPLQNFLALLKIPILSTSIPSRIIVLFSFSFVVLAAFGFDKFILLLQQKAYKKILPPIFIVGLLLVVLVGLSVLHIFPKENASLALHNLILPIFLFIVSLGAVLVSLVWHKQSFIFILSLLFLILTLFDSLRFVTKWMPTDPKDLVFPTVPVISSMQKNIGQGRVYGDFGAYVDTYYDLPSIEGYDPLYNKRYGEFIQSASTGQFTPALRSVVALDKRGKYSDRVLDILGVTIVYHPVSRTNQSWAFPVWKKEQQYSLLYDDKTFQLYKNKSALPHAVLFYNYEVISNDKNIIKRVYSDNFDYKHILLLEENPGLQKVKKTPKNNVLITSYTPNKVGISVDTPVSAILFLSDSDYPAWQATVNGKNVKIYRADYAFRSVVVPAGKSKVEFYYRGLF